MATYFVYKGTKYGADIYGDPKSGIMCMRFSNKLGGDKFIPTHMVYEDTECGYIDQNKLKKAYDEWANEYAMFHGVDFESNIFLNMF